MNKITKMSNAINNVFSDKVINTVMLKYLSPLSFLVLKRTIPEFYRCSVVKNLVFKNFFETKLFYNLCDYFGDVDIANILMEFLKNTEGHTHLLTGSFMLNTLNGDDINNCGDIDIVHFGDDCSFCFNVFREEYNGFNSISEALKNKENIITDSYSYKHHPSNKYIENIENITIVSFDAENNRIPDSKKIQVIDVESKNVESFFDGFDLKICQNYYNDKFGIHVQDVSSIIERKCKIDIDKVYFLHNPNTMIAENILDLCDSVYERLNKYSKRGYDIIVNPASSIEVLEYKMGKLKYNLEYNQDDVEYKMMKNDIDVYFPNSDTDNVNEFIGKYLFKNEFRIRAYAWCSFWNRLKKINGDLIFPKGGV